MKNQKIEDAIRNGAENVNEILKEENAGFHMERGSGSLELTEAEKAVTRCGDDPSTANGYAIFDDGITPWKGVVVNGKVNFGVDMIDGEPVQTVYATIAGKRFQVIGSNLVNC